jgi:hypothetical protein
MPHAQLWRWCARVQLTLQPPTPVRRAVICIGEDEPDPPHEPGVKVVQVPLGTPAAQAQGAGHATSRPWHERF